jgi:hypothetical protein
MRLSRRRIAVGVAVLAASAIVVVAAVRRHQALETSAANEPSSTRAHTQTGGVPVLSAAQLERLENSFRALEDGDRESPRDRWDPAYVVEQLGKEPNVLYDWVRHNTYWVAYQGVLRGPAGVLMDRQGNSLDRALLLAKLLQVAGYESRVARGELSSSTAAELLPALVATRRDSLAAAAPDSASFEEASRATRVSDLRAVAAQYELDGNAIERVLNSYTRAAVPVIEKLNARVTDQTARLLSILEKPEARAEWRKRHERALQALRDHWWVQWRDGENWHDLDLLASGSNAVPLVAIPTAEVAVSRLDGSLYQQVSVRVIAEQWSSGALTERVVLDSTLLPAGLIGKPIVLQLWPARWPADLAPQIDSPYGLRAAALEQNEWTATLQVGTDVIAQGMLADSGTEDSGGAGAPGGLGGIGGAMTNAVQRGSQQGTTAGGQELTATWIEYELRLPDAPPRTIRRAVFDLLGPAKRAARPRQLSLDETARLTRSLALMMRTEILPLVCAIAPEFATHVMAQSLRENRDMFQKIAGEEFDLASQATQQLLEQAVPAMSTLYSLALSKWAWSRSTDGAYMDQPALFTRHRFMKPVGTGAALVDATDIVTNEVAVALSMPDAFAVRVEQGVFDTNAEALLHGSAITTNTAEAFAITGEWLALTSQRKEELAHLKLADDERSRIAGDLEAGYTVIVPRAPVKIAGREFVGWWRVDPRTGDSLGISHDGWGGAAAERSVLSSVLWAGARGFVFEALTCQAVPLGMNELLDARAWIHENIGRPSWTRPVPAYRYQDPTDIIMANLKRCIFAAMVMGVVAALPVILLHSRMGLRAAEVAEAGNVRPPSTPPPEAPPSSRPPPSAPPSSGNPAMHDTLPLEPRVTEFDPLKPLELGETQKIPKMIRGPVRYGPKPRPTPQEMEAARNRIRDLQKILNREMADAMRYSPSSTSIRGVPYDPTLGEPAYERARNALDEYTKAINKQRALEEAMGIKSGSPFAGRQPAPPPRQIGNDLPTQPRQEAAQSAADKMKVGFGGLGGGE